MSHNIQENDIVVSTSQTWHGLEVLEPEINFENSGLNWLVAEKPVYVYHNGEQMTIKAYKALIRQDTGLPINVSKNTYQIIQNYQIFEAMKRALDGIDYTIETTGSLGNCKKIFLSLDIAGSENEVFGDKFQNKMIFTSSHDGSSNFRVYDSSIRVVCQNTLNASLASNKTLNFKIRHTKNADIKIANMEETIQEMFEARKEFYAGLKRLSEIEVSKDEARKVLIGFFSSKDLSTRAANRALDCYNKFLSGIGNNGESRYDLLNGLTESLTHAANKNDDAKNFSSSEFGSAANKKAEFVQVVSDNEAFADLVAKGENVLSNVDKSKDGLNFTLNSF